MCSAELQNYTEVHSRRVHHLSHSEASCIFPFFLEKFVQKRKEARKTSKEVCTLTQQQHPAYRSLCRVGLVVVSCTPNARKERAPYRRKAGGGGMRDCRGIKCLQKRKMKKNALRTSSLVEDPFGVCACVCVCVFVSWYVLLVEPRLVLR